MKSDAQSGTVYLRAADGAHTLAQIILKPFDAWSGISVFSFPMLLIVAVALALGGGWSSMRLKDEPKLIRALFLLCALAFAGTLMLMAGFTACAALSYWNSDRLAVLMSAAAGQPLYGDPTHGVLSSWIYGPLPVLFYLPASLFHTPTTCLIVGALTSQLLLFAPSICALSIWGRRELSMNRLLLPLMAALLLCIAYRTESITGAALFIGPDAPAIASMLMACVVLLGGRSGRRIAASAVLAVMACWCKQTAFPFALVPLLFLWRVEGRAAAVAYLKWLLISGAMISGLILWWCGPSAVYFNMFFLPSRQPLQYSERGNVAAFLVGLMAWAVRALVPLLPLAVAGVLAIVLKRPWKMRGATDCRRVGILSTHPWLIFALAGLALMPTGVLGYIKVSGRSNNFAGSHLCLLLAGIIGVLDLLPQVALARLPLFKTITCLITLCALTGSMGRDMFHPGYADSLAISILAPQQNLEETAYQLELMSPGVVYFPWNPLPVWLVEKKLYHFEWGFVDRVDAHLPPSRQQVMEHVPAHIQYVAIPQNWTRNCLQFLPEFNVPLGSSRIPGFELFGRSAMPK